MNTEPTINDLFREIEAIRGLLDELLGRQSVQDFYSTDEFAEIIERRPKTVRDYCNEGRLKGIKKASGHGLSKDWAIPHAELERYRREGLLPRQQRVNRSPALAGV
ncbi:helix-turn-helix domain-containing protein [Tautonia marina]|uniref:helix-turn-helix domain-containing protein n=1 Tax=Tautonia marina TaxID=2653855 RepID=UPI0012609074|nr:helix-turn-helix domain-containing protein [Tautonia marina]